MVDKLPPRGCYPGRHPLTRRDSDITSRSWLLFSRDLKKKPIESGTWKLSPRKHSGSQSEILPRSYPFAIGASREVFMIQKHGASHAQMGPRRMMEYGSEGFFSYDSGIGGHKVRRRQLGKAVFYAFESVPVYRAATGTK